MNTLVKSPEGMRRIARAFLSRMRCAPHGKAFVVGLSGELGAGKTTFVKALAKEFGIRRTVQSPTFILERTYQIPKAHPLARRFARLVHIDAYRLTEGDEVFAAHFQILLSDSKNLIVVEWPERIIRVLPKKFTRISFVHKNSNTRSASIRRQ